ncbi:hypothetical protein [Streptomyces triticiradicis]|uniref:Uncharacterized protein n=1 Tax=Streptomyces triticiradicis TaxID=2651189 RepID=A0A7J5D3G9_9ACTN|nr:hypothetical protein [Streptomyces triticiradicis]KAB1976728.1 hypothetical protein F8144_43605 [Streptomyces triticiradicis]
MAWGDFVGSLRLGLDELDTDSTSLEKSRAQAVLQALNSLPNSRGPAPAVVTCRQDRYAALADMGYQLRDAAWIALQPVSVEAATSYLKRRDADGRWLPVLTALTARRAPALAQALTTPWRLTLAATAYTDSGDPAELLTHTTAEAVDAHLLSRFVPAATRLHPPPFEHADAQQIHRWLHHLAAYLTTPPVGANPVGCVLGSGVPVLT